MSGVLGPGVRVWIGWCPERFLNRNPDCRLSAGTITRGPVPQQGVMTFFVVSDRFPGHEVHIAGYLLTPLDGGEPERVETEDEVVA